MNKFNDGENLSIIISSYLGFKERLNILEKVVENLRKYFPKSEIIVLFDKLGVDSVKGVNKCITHKNGLGYSWNHGIEIAKNNYILQTEDDWEIKNFINKDTIDKLITQSFELLNDDKVECIRIDAAMFDKIGGSICYPLGYQKLEHNNIEYWIYNIPTEEDVKKNGWLKYYFCNHPHLKLKSKINSFKYIENERPNIVETDACKQWRDNKWNCGYIDLLNNKDKSYFKHKGGKFSYAKIKQSVP